FFKDQLEIEHINALIRYASDLVSDELLKADIIEEDLLKREKNGSTVLTGKGIILLHCRTDGVQSLKFGVLRLSQNKPINYLNNGKEEKINTALIMMAPIDKNMRHLEVISEISQNLIEGDNFVDTLVQGTNENIYKEINRILNRFLNSKINERQEDF
ncbi:MAG: PTS sugar transporter subunit IIA, partial [Clostridia bacterium]|nr:PTS sugar transporter subunit IIA [Clostridia bacterium]